METHRRIDLLVTYFTNPQKARTIIEKYISPQHLGGLSMSKDEVLNEIWEMFKRGGLSFKESILENELATLTENKSTGHGGRQVGKSFSAVQDWSESFDDMGAASWESHFDPGQSITDPD